MAIVEQFSIDPAQNTKAAPLGAPEHGVPWERVSDIFRVVMAAAAELLVKTTELDARITDVQSNPAGSADNAVRFGGRTRQQAYDDIWPVGSVRAWLSTSPSGLTPVGLVATWVLVAQDALIAGANPDPGATYPAAGGTVGSGTAASASAVAAHTHTATTSATAAGVALTPAQVGSNLDATPVTEAVTGSPRRLVRVSPEIEATVPLGGANTHTHAITATTTVAAAGAHDHAITLPKRYAPAWFRRSA